MYYNATVSQVNAKKLACLEVKGSWAHGNIHDVFLNG
jgi:hypothetical protein